MSNHPTKLLVLHNDSISIDEELAPLIQKIWDSGISTQFCCQGDKDENYDTGYILFTTIGDFTKFVTRCGGLKKLLPNLESIEIGSTIFVKNTVRIGFFNNKVAQLTKLFSPRQSVGKTSRKFRYSRKHKEVT